MLLTTPESLEAMLMSRRVESERLFGGVQAVVVDEIHAFAGDDRGWHLLAVLARLDALAGREIQRIGLSATVGNPDWLLDWLVCGGAGRARGRAVVPSDGGGELELTVDWVASDDERRQGHRLAAPRREAARLRRQPRAGRVARAGAAGRGDDVFVSHSSLSRDDRRQAERAFAETRDCVIVATSTLELGIDVGDLDRVIQIGAPRDRRLAASAHRTNRAAGRHDAQLPVPGDDRHGAAPGACADPPRARRLGRTAHRARPSR